MKAAYVYAVEQVEQNTDDEKAAALRVLAAHHASDLAAILGLDDACHGCGQVPQGGWCGCVQPDEDETCCAASDTAATWVVDRDSSCENGRSMKDGPPLPREAVAPRLTQPEGRH